MYPDLFKIGPITIHSFGVMAMLGFLIPTLILRKEFRRLSIDPDLANNIAVGAIIGGFLGARLYFIIEHWGDFLRDPAGMIFSGAGLVWYGGLVGGVLGVLLVIRSYQNTMFKKHGAGATVPSIFQFGDMIMPLILLGYAFGRVGCQLAGDGDYGPPSDLPWAMAYPRGVVPIEARVHPTPLYDIILSTALFFVLWKLRKRPFATGTLFGLALIAMGVERFITEFFRNTPKIAFDWMSLAQIISVVMVIAGVIIINQAKKAQAKSPAVAGKTAASVAASKNKH